MNECTLNYYINFVCILITTAKLSGKTALYINLDEHGVFNNLIIAELIICDLAQY